MVRALQIIVHLPLFKVLLPANALYFNMQVIEIAMFDIIPAKFTFDIFFRYGEVKTKIS